MVVKMIEGTAFAATASGLSGPPHNTGKLKVINLWAGPGAGKSTTASAIFNVMKKAGFEVELIPEVAKSLTYEHAMARLDNQLLVLAKQEHQLRRLIGQVEYVIVDSPFPLGLAYCNPEHVGRYQPLIDSLWGDYDNYDFFISRTRQPFKTVGRNQSYAEAVKLDAEVYALWVDYSQAEMEVIDADNFTAEYLIIDAVLMAQGLKTLAERYAEVPHKAVEGAGPDIEFVDQAHWERVIGNE